MNTLLINKGIYTQNEFQKYFVEWAMKEQIKSSHFPNENSRS